MRRLRHSGFTAFALAATALVGCSGSDDSLEVHINGITGQPQVLLAHVAPDSMKPMTVFEKRRLISRIAQDPKQLNRLTKRERREVLGMVQAVEGDDGDED